MWPEEAVTVRIKREAATAAGGARGGGCGIPRGSSGGRQPQSLGPPAALRGGVALPEARMASGAAHAAERTRGEGDLTHGLIGPAVENDVDELHTEELP